jgi:predicted DsbA family dithiol-disulfide isomerase
MRSDVIEVFADITCPFAHVGLRRLVAHRRMVGRDDVRLHVRAWPLELVNGEPLEAGTVAHKVDELRAQVAPDLFTGFPVDRFPTTTLPALALAGLADEEDLDAGERVNLALRDALFEHGEDISSTEVLDDLARRFGVRPPNPDDQARVLADLEEGRARGVVGSPHFFVGDEDWFCPALQISQVGGELQIERDLETFEAFSRTCFGS